MITGMRANANKNVIYIAYVGKYNNMDTYKYGKSYDVYTRVSTHKKNFQTFDLRNIYHTNFKDQVETILEQELKLLNIHKSLIINSKNQTELFNTTEIYTINFVNKLVKDIISDIECTDSLRAKLMIEQLRYEKLKLRKEIKEMDYKIQCIKNKFITK